MINTIRLNKQTINKKATFQFINEPQVKIVLPTTPSTIIVPHFVEKVIPENIVVKPLISSTTMTTNELLQFIDFDKLIDIKQSKNVNVYELKHLKDLAKKLNINTSNVKKKLLIEKIKSYYYNQFGDQPNLIADIKQLKDSFNINQITKLFEQHNIITNKQELLDQIKNIMSTKHHVVNDIIKILETKWINPTLS